MDIVPSPSLHPLHPCRARGLPTVSNRPHFHEILDVDTASIQKQLEALILEKEIIREEDLIWVKPLYLAELGIARELARIHQHTSALRQVNQEKALEWVQKLLKLELAKEQKEAVASAMQDKIHIITGGPGTGKSTITRAILAITEKLTNRILLAAPTGRAAKRMSEITGKKAFTIHALLEMDFKSGGFKRKKENPLECDLLIIDEASMIDTLLMNNLLKAVPNGARVILLGISTSCRASAQAMCSKI